MTTRTADSLVESLMLDTIPNVAAAVDFGLDNEAPQERYAALQRCVQVHNITADQLHAVVGDGPSISKLVAETVEAEYAVTFRTVYDGMADYWEESEELEELEEPYKEPYKASFDTGQGYKITSVVCDQVDFDKMCDKLEGIIDLSSGDRADKSQIDSIREAKHLPMAVKGSRTQCLFDMFNVETDRLSVCVRGFGERMMQG
ncbi:hypothetical protein N9045_01730 [bacterium]|nr:hypothetical protein [bacterium]